MRHICKHCLLELNSDEAFMLHTLDHTMREISIIMQDINESLDHIKSALKNIEAVIVDAYDKKYEII